MGFFGFFEGIDDKPGLKPPRYVRYAAARHVAAPPSNRWSQGGSGNAEAGGREKYDKWSPGTQRGSPYGGPDPVPPMTAALKDLQVSPHGASSSSAPRWKPHLPSYPRQHGRGDNLEEAQLEAVLAASTADQQGGNGAAPPPSDKQGGKGAVHQFAQSGGWLQHWSSAWQPREDGY